MKNLPGYKSLLFGLLVLSTLCIAVSCEQPKVTPVAASESATINTKLYRLYLTRANMVSLLTTYQHGSGGSKSVKKLLFEFYFKAKTPILTMVGFRSQKRNQDVDSNNVVELTAINNVSAIDFSNEDLVLNNQETKDDTEIEKLVTAAKQPNSNFFLFTPTKVTVGSRTYVAYEISAIANLNDANKMFAAITRLNPSPPHNGD